MPTLAEASQLNRKGRRDADPQTSIMPKLAINEHLQPNGASQIDLRTANGGSGNAMEHIENVLGRGATYNQ
jgi:hypothetical protein